MGVVFEVGDDTNDLLVPFIMGKNNLISKEKINELYMDTSLGKISSDDFWEKCGLKNTEQHNYCKEYLDSKLTLDCNFLPVAKNFLKNLILVCYLTMFLNGLFIYEKIWN